MGNGAARVTQHRNQREVARGRELADLKKENRALRKQLTRLRKQLLRVMEIHNLHDSGTEEVPEGSPETRPTCPGCGSINLASVTLPTGVLVACKDCGRRKVEKHE